MRTFHVGQYVYHGWRYWKTDGLEPSEVPGWNTLYLPYRIIKITAAWIVVRREDTTFNLNRRKMVADGKQYHSRVHEYFYAEEPSPESKDWNWGGANATRSQPLFGGDCFVVLGLALPCSRDDVRRAYRQLAKKAHPDLGGDHHEFIKLKQAHDSALRFASV